MKVDVITIFPEYFSPLRVSLLGKAAERGLIEFAVHDLRTWAHDVHSSVDDTPFGGGPGMVMSPVPWGEALDAVTGATGTRHQAGRAHSGGRTVPAGDGRHVLAYGTSCVCLWAIRGDRRALCRRRAHPRAGRRGQRRGLRAFRGRAGGPCDDRRDLPAAARGARQCRLRARRLVRRRRPGRWPGLLEGPVFTRPRVWREREVPAVLLSGDHAAIARWRRDEALRRTAALRPDLMAALPSDTLDRRDREVLHEAGFPVPGEDMAH